MPRDGSGRAKAVIFDIGGVLTFSPRITDFEVFGQWEQAMGLGPGEITLRAETAWKAGRVGSVSQGEFRSQLGESLGWNEHQVQSFMDDFWVEYRGTPNNALIAYMAGLRSRCKTALLSNSFIGARQHQRELCDITDISVYSDEVGISKPDPRIYTRTCNELQVLPRHAAFVDDIESNVVAAQELGMCGILFETNAQTMADIDKWLAS